MNPLLNTVLLGHGSLGLAMAQGLLNVPHVNLKGVYAWCNHPNSQHPQFHARLDAPLKRLAKQHGIVLLSLGKTDEPAFLDWLQANNIHWIQLACWGEIIRPPLLNWPGLHIINCHPSLLPWHKGPNPYASVIRTNDPETGVSFHRVDSGIDTGPILWQAAIPVSETDTGGSLQAKTDALAQAQVHQVYQRLAFPHFGSETSQPHAGSYYKPFVEEDALIQWLADPAAVERNSRALLPWLEPYAWWNGETLIAFKRLKLVKAESKTTELLPPGALVQTGRDSCLVASRDPNWHYRLEGYRLAMGNRFLPRLLSQGVGAWLLRPEWGSFWHSNMQEVIVYN